MEWNLNVEGRYIHQIAGIQLNRRIFTPASHHPLSRPFPSEVLISIYSYPWGSGLSSMLNSTTIPLSLCLLGIAVPSCVMVLHFIRRCVCTKRLNYGTLNETVCRAWAKLWDIFSLCWTCHGPCCISLGNSCWVASFSLSHITPGSWKARVSCQAWDFWDGCFPTGNVPVLAYKTSCLINFDECSGWKGNLRIRC